MTKPTTRPAPAKKAIKPVILWADPTTLSSTLHAYLLPVKARKSDIPVLVIDLSPESVEALKAQISNSIYRAYNKSDVAQPVDLAIAVLADLGIKARK